MCHCITNSDSNHTKKYILVFLRIWTFLGKFSKGQPRCIQIYRFVVSDLSAVWSAIDPCGRVCIDETNQMVYIVMSIIPVSFEFCQVDLFEGEGQVEYTLVYCLFLHPRLKLLSCTQCVRGVPSCCCPLIQQLPFRWKHFIFNRI